MPRLPDAKLAHIGFYVRDLDRMIDFYQRAMGMVVTDSGDYYMGGRIVFMSRDASEHHQVVLASGRSDDGSLKFLNQMSFRVDSLEDLKVWHDWLVSQNVDEMNPRNHGNAWSIYFRDPEGNRIEVYTGTPWYVAQPFGQPLDLSEPADVIREKTKALLKGNPTLVSSEQWSATLDQKIDAD